MDKGYNPLFFTAEPQSTLRKNFFSFPLRGRKAKIPSLTGHDGTLVVDRYLPMTLVHQSNTECFSFAVLSTAKEKVKSLCVLCVSSEAGGESKSK